MIDVATSLALMILPLGLALSLAKWVLSAILFTAGGKLESARKD